MKSARIWRFYGPYFPAFGLNTERYGVSLRIQFECGKIRTRKTPNTDTFIAVQVLLVFSVNGTNAGFTKDNSDRTTGVKVTTPMFPSGGVYYISCIFNNTLAINATGIFYVIDNETVTVTSVTPNVTAIDTTANITFTGTNFLNSPELVCLYGKNQEQSLTALYVSSTSILCQLPAQSKSIISDLVLSFVAKERKQNLYFKAKHHISVNGPKVSSAAFDSSLAFVEITFNNKAVFANKNANCRDIFPYHYTEFGNKGSCRLTADTVLQIGLVDGPTLTPGTLYIDLTKINIKGAEYTVHVNQSHNITITAPTLRPDISLAGPSNVGKYARLLITLNRVSKLFKRRRLNHLKSFIH